jgi:glycosyltransferase involved in cell wall biosynthesis
MRIALIIQKPQARGQELFASHLGNYFLELGHEVVLISLYPGEFRLPFEGRQVELKANSIGFQSLRQISALLREFHPELVQANGGDTLKFAVLARLLFSFPGKLVFNNGGVVGYYLKSSLQRLFYRFLLARLDGAISVSEFSGKELKRWIPGTVPQGIIPIGIPRNQEFDLAPRVTHSVFVHMGGFTPEKNHTFLFDLFQRYLEEDPQAQLWLIGDGPLKETFESFSFDKGIPGIRFLGAKQNPWSLVPENAILLFPSIIEGMPAVIAEAFMAQIPVIASPVGGIPEMEVGIPTCSLVSLENMRGWLSAMLFWSSIAKEGKNEAAQLGKAVAHLRFDLNRIGNNFLNFYQSL